MALSKKEIIEIAVQVNSKGMNALAKELRLQRKEVDGVEKSQKKLTRQRDRYNRLEKGTAGISSNTTKNFSKMQQNIDGGGTGTGGLVRAYALLAANVFALTAAFGVLQRSAQIDQLTQSMEILSTTGGTNIELLSKKLVEASGGAIALEQSFRQVSLAASAGLNTQEIEGLTQVAKGAAISLGRDLPDALDRIFRGAIKLEPEILDEIGLFVRVDEAAQRYGQTIGKSASSLTQAEKRQAFLNEILEQGTRKFQEYADEVEPDAFTQLAAALRDISQDLLSFINSGLGPFVRFLSESRTLLTTIFVVFAGVLLKQAIPAVGQFTQNLERSALEALEDRKIFIEAQQDKLRAAKKFALEQNKTQLKSAKESAKVISDENRLQKTKERFTTSAKGALPEKMLKRQLDTSKRLAVVNKRMEDLDKARLKTKAKSSALIDAELEDLRAEQKALNEIVRLEKEQNRINAQGITPKKGTIADIQNQKTLNKAISATATSSVVASAETQGLRKGFKDYFATLQSGKVQVDGVEQTMTKGTKASFAFKGGVSLLGTAFSRLMMSLGPIMMAFSLLSPLLILGAKKLGLMSEEGKILQKSTDDLEKATEKLTDRFLNQAVAMQNLSLTFLENIKASLAFTRSQVETSQQIQQVQHDLDVYNATASNTQKALDAAGDGTATFTAALTGGAGAAKVAKVAFFALVDSLVTTNKEAANVAIAQANASQVFGAFAADNKELIEVISERVDVEGKLKTSLEGITTGTKEIAKTEADFKKLMKGNTTLRSEYTDALLKGKENLDDYVKTLSEEEKTTLKLTPANIALLNSRLKANKQIQDGSEATKALNLSQRDQVEIAVEIEKTVNDQIRAYESFVSAVEGAKEAVRQFQSQAIPKTDVDQVLNSLRQIKASFEDLSETEQVEYFKNFKDADNAINKLFNQSEINRIIEGGDDASKAYNEVLMVFVDIQSQLQLNAQEQTNINSLLKAQSQFVKLSGDIAMRSEMEKTNLANKQLDIAKTNFRTQGRRYSLDEKSLRDEAKRLINLRDQKTLYKEIEKGAINVGGVQISTQDANALISGELKIQNEEFKNQLITKTEIERKDKARELAILEQIKLEKTLSDTTSKRLVMQEEFEKTVRAGRDPNASVAQANLAAALEEVRAKEKLLNQQTKVQDAQLKLLQAEFKIVAKRAKIAEGSEDYVAIENALQDGSDAITATLKENAKIAGLEFAKAISGTVKSGLAGNPAGIRNVGAGEEARLARLKELEAIPADQRTEAQKQEIENLKDLNLGYLAVIQTVKDYQTELAKLGPDGEFLSAVIGGTMKLRDGFLNLGDQLAFIKTKTDEGAEGFHAKGAAMATAAARAEFAGAALESIGSIMAAESTRQISEIDSQIEAEKRRDGKSKESLARIDAMEKKKEAMKKKAFEQNKKVQMAVTIANTAASVMAALAPPPIGLGPAFGMPLAVMQAAMGALQLAVIARTSYQGGSSKNVPKPNTNLEIGKRSSAVDVSQSATGGELNYLRGGRTTGTNLGGAGASFPGGAMGRKGYANGGEGVVVGERGPEVITPAAPVDITPNFALGGQPANVNFTINAVDAAGVEDVLMNQRGNLIRMIREAANENGERFLETVDTQSYGGSK